MLHAVMWPLHVYHRLAEVDSPQRVVNDQLYDLMDDSAHALFDKAKKEKKAKSNSTPMYMLANVESEDSAESKSRKIRIDIPGGKRMLGESPIDCALREGQEETGINFAEYRSKLREVTYGKTPAQHSTGLLSTAKPAHTPPSSTPCSLTRSRWPAASLTSSSLPSDRWTP